MKKMLLLSLVISITLILASYKVAINRINADVLSVLGFSKSLADEHILSSVTLGSAYFARPLNIAQFASKSGGEKTKVANELCIYIKSYVYSQEFKDKYEAYRQSKKPIVRQLSEDEKAAARDLIAQMEEMFSPEMLDMLPPEGKANALQSIEDEKRRLNGEMTRSQLADWEREAPLDPYKNIKNGLQTFLDETRDVDYDAATQLNTFNMKIFENPEYENKPYNWKACYRAGREVSEAGRNFAKEWLAELKSPV